MLSTSLWPPATSVSRTCGGGVTNPSAPLAPARGASGPARRANRAARRTTWSPRARSLRTAWIQPRRIIASHDAAGQHHAVVAQAAVLGFQRLEREPGAEAVRDDADAARAGAVGEVAQ